jgi:hypothetical protein
MLIELDNIHLYRKNAQITKMKQFVLKAVSDTAAYFSRIKYSQLLFSTFAPFLKNNLIR